MLTIPPHFYTIKIDRSSFAQIHTIEDVSFVLGVFVLGVFFFLRKKTSTF